MFGPKSKKIQRLKDKKSRKRQKVAKKSAPSNRSAMKMVHKCAKDSAKNRTKSYCGGGKRTRSASAMKSSAKNPIAVRNASTRYTAKRR